MTMNMKAITTLVSSMALLLLGSTAYAQIDNTNFGTGTLPVVTVGADYNSAFGFDALNADTTGTLNTAVGFKSLLDNTTGYDNTAVGRGSMFHNDSGFWNVALGSTTLYTNTTGLYSTAVGYSAL